MTSDQDRPRTVNELRDELSRLLTHPDLSGPAMLHRHAALLDEIMAALIREHLAGRLGESHYDLEDWLAMVLRVQKQCADTVRTAAAIDYMKFCTGASAPFRSAPRVGHSEQDAPPLPPPPETGEQTEGDL